ncbi:hypothetical protein OAQ87_01340, partial [Candidatus Marinimicrobia bacterium]|nr:hypothetical protein [Candidatus Neomarinimicrobiota bacterium]
DGIWGENDNQNVEPFEDRNCNNIRDLSESLDVINDCPDYSSGDGSFCDTGNGKWDDKEDLFDLCSLELDGNCYEYQKLFQRSEAPNQLIVNYEEQALPTPFLEIYPQGNFFDTGQDGCFDIFETGNESSPCMCEFTDYNEDIPSCIDYLNDLGLLEDSNGDSFADGDLNMDEEITEFDIALISNMASIQSLNGVLFNFGVNASAYNYGQCIDNFSGSKEDCCINNGCTWTNENCTLDSESCLIEIDEIYWLENLDPNNDNGITELDGVWQNSEQSNFYISSNLEIIGLDTYYANELLNASLYDPYVKSPDYILTKFLDYDDDFSKGGDEIQIIEHGFEIQNKSAYAPIIESENKVVSNEVIDQIDFDDSENELLISDYIQELNKYHLVKTEFTNSSSLEDYDYMIFKGESEDVVKMIHPYYHFLPGNSYPQDINEFSDDDFWQSVDLQSDTLVYAFNGSDGNIIEGQSYHSFNSISSDTANYSIEKEYIVTSEKADLKHPVKDPNCSELNSADSCEDETNFWCRWDNELSICESTDITSITDCLLVTRVITTTAIGPGVSYKLKSENYFKPGFGMVKEDIFIYWAALPWIDTPWYPISSIQYKTPGRSLEISQSSGFLNRKLTNIENFGNIDNFENDDYKIINTFGLQRVEYPIGY